MRHDRWWDLFSEGIDVREKGEYLRYDEEDIYEGEENRFEEEDRAQDRWREKVFYRRVKTAVADLVEQRLCDGAGSNKRDSVERDYLDWKQDKKYNEKPYNGYTGKKFLGIIGRSDVTDNETCRNKLKEYLKTSGKSIQDIYEALQELYFSRTEHTVKEIENIFKTDAVDKVWCSKPEGKTLTNAEQTCNDRIKVYFPFEKGKDINRHIETEIKRAYWKIIKEEQTIEEAVEEMILNIVTTALWRPDYGTLDALIELCLSGRVSEIITYNFDTYFDRLINSEAVRATYSNIAVKSEYRVCICDCVDTEPLTLKDFSVQPEESDLTIYHVHGIIDDKINEDRQIIFSGTSYSEYGLYSLNKSARRFADIYDRSEMLLCVGFSGSDANFRRLARQMRNLKKSPVFHEVLEKPLYIARAWKDDARRYNFMELGKKDRTGKFVCDKADNEKTRIAYCCLKAFMSMVNNYYEKEFGVYIYWFEGYSQMAKGIKKLAK